MLGNMKRILALVLVVAMTVALVSGCAPKPIPVVALTLWGSQDDQAMLQTMADSFTAAHTDKTYTITLGVAGEDVAKDTVLKDLDAAGDVFAFASDQIAALQSAGALLPVTIDTAAITAANSPASVTASTVDGQLVAYPSSADTYFLYYDKKYLSDAEAGSLETIMSKSQPTGVTNFAMNLSNGWYIASFFFAGGCKLFGDTGTDPTVCDFNNAGGLAAGQYMIKLTADKKKFADYGANYDSTMCQNFKDRKLAAAVSGTWNATKVQEALGTDYGATKLPTININGSDVNMGSFANFKLYGVNSHTKSPADAMALAEWVTNQANQLVRFQTRSFAPTNVTVAADTATLSSNLAVAADALQGKFATLQPSIKQISNYWTPAAALGTSIETGKTTAATLQKDLDALVKQILAALQ
jgi:arabinogalactan oligomer/maltooligosaccharide transport system substrate-binding protein